ncbi:MAG: hypothetical protein J6X18_09585 [Bacteroidales bacterium]|nr:hypothetical protein [Bacteroidales bacterium]
MKARIKGTNTIVECLDTGTLINENKGIECKHSNGAIEVIPGDCLMEIENDFDWQSFRAEAAKDILCAMIARGEKAKPIVVDIAIDGADELIKQLKEKEEI